MELPFAVESSSPAHQHPSALPQHHPHHHHHHHHRRVVVYQDDNDDDDDGSSSLVTAASVLSRGSLQMMGESQASYDPIRAPATALLPSRGGGGAGGMDYPYANTTKNLSSSVQQQQLHQRHQQQHHTAVPGGARHSSATPPPPPPPPAFSNFDGLDSVLSHFGVTSPPPPVPAVPATTGNHQLTMPNQLGLPGTTSTAAQRMPNPPPTSDLLNDFTYVTVCETDEGDDDVVLGGADEEDIDGSSFVMDAEQRGGRSDRDSILAVLVRHSTATSASPSAAATAGEGGDFPSVLEHANQMAEAASLAKRQGDLVQAIDCHSESAKLYRDAAALVRNDSRTCFHDLSQPFVVGWKTQLKLTLQYVHLSPLTASMRNSLLALSQTQAKTALALKRIIRIRPSASHFPTMSSSSKSTPGHKPSSHQEQVLREKVRGALSNKSEEDISQSTFLGRATVAASDTRTSNPTTNPSSPSPPVSSERNPVDEMMELERELRNMDMVIEMGSSLASLEARTQHRMKSSIVEGSFMVVPPGSNSYMSSSSSYSVPSSQPQQQQQQPLGVHGAPSARPAVPKDVVGTASVRARANRVQSILEASGRPGPAATGQVASTLHQPGAIGSSKPPASGTSLDSSWWGNSSQASQVLTSSVISLASGIGVDHLHGTGGGGGSGPSSTKQLLMHMDSFKTLRDENEALLKEVVGAKAARMEAKAAKEQMLQFQEEYRRRFAALKEALEKYRKDHPPDASPSSNPVSTSNFAKSSTAASEQLSRQEQLIKKLTADLKKEKEESKKKDSALLKYESFYREVKARSAAKQRQKETQQLQAQRQAAQVRHATKPTAR
jgi:hypothetical protein